ncbi:hypothetical protein [Gordonia sihwensis]|uniref:helix-turn-helix domain-containing protein n=1 Tax=Gordonia sihwensis TaxID=173559 RepID=UPI003D9592A4
MIEMRMSIEERRKRVAELLEQGYSSNAKVALALGVGKETVRRDREALRPRRELTKDQIRTIQTRLAEGLPIAATAREVGCSPSEIRSKFPEYTPHKYTDEEKIAKLDDFEWLLDSGVWPPTAASRIGMQLATVCQWYRRLEIPMPKRIAAISRDLEKKQAAS